MSGFESIEDQLAECEDAIARYGDATNLEGRARVAWALAAKALPLFEQGHVEEALAACDELLARYGAASEVEIREQVAAGLYNKGAILDMLHQRGEAVAALGALLAKFSEGESERSTNISGARDRGIKNWFTQAPGSKSSSRRSCGPEPPEPHDGVMPIRASRRYFSGFVPAIQMITRLNFPSASKSNKLQLCMSFFEPSFSSPI